MNQVVAISLAVLLSLPHSGVAKAPTKPTLPESRLISTVMLPTTEAVESVVVDPEYNIVINEDEVIALAKMAWGEARGTSDMEVAATMWCVLNRVDASGDSIIEVVTAPYQFVGYGEWCPVEERFTNLAVDVLTRWQMEKQGASPEEVGRVLPQEYTFFHGEGGRNHFRDSFRGGNIWNWDCDNPYETE